MCAGVKGDKAEQKNLVIYLHSEKMGQGTDEQVN